jgi:hypothetical protein
VGFLVKVVKILNPLLCRFYISNWTNIVSVGLEVAGLRAIGEVLNPGVVGIELTRTPILGSGKIANTFYI